MKIALVSNSPNCIPLLHYLVQNKVQVNLFAEAEDTGHESFAEVAHFCRFLKVPIQSNGTIYNWLKQVKPDVVFILGYKHLIHIQKIEPHLHQKLFNIHFGVLPQYKGPSPVFWQLKNGEPNPGISIHLINEKFDDGDIVWMKKIKREPYFSYGILEQYFRQLLIEGVIYIVQQIIQNKNLIPIPKEFSKNAYQRRPELKDIVIDWNTMNASQITNLINACNPWNKGATTFFKGSEIKIMDAYIDEATKHENITPGTIIETGTSLKVACIQNEVLTITFLNSNGIFIPSRHAAGILGFHINDVFQLPSLS